MTTLMIILHRMELLALEAVIGAAVALAILIILLPLIIPIVQWQIRRYTMKNCQRIVEMAWGLRQGRAQSRRL